MGLFRKSAKPYVDKLPGSAPDVAAKLAEKRAAICAEYDDVMHALQRVARYVKGFNGEHHSNKLADAASVELARRLRETT